MRRPNILILSTDQLRWDAIGANGNPDVQTPNLDRLAAGGLTFTRHFVQNPVCMPSRLSFLTGQYRRVEPDHPEYLDQISPGLPPLAESWRRALRVPDTVRHPEVRFPKEPIPFRAPSHLTHAAFVAEQSMEFIRQQGQRPWLCIAGFYSPHSPWVAPQEYLDRYDRASLRLPAFPPEVDARRPGTEYDDAHLRAARHGYYAMVSEVDHHAGRLLALLDEAGLAEHTIVILTSDHGDWLGEQLRHGNGYPAPDVVSRVPLLIRWPAGIHAPGRAVEDIVEAVDVLPTLMESAGIPVPPHVQGRSLLPLLEHRGAGARDSALTEAAGWKALRTERYRYICRSGAAAASRPPAGAAAPAEHLWDLERDPGEYHDVAGDPDYAGALADLRRLLLQRVLQNEQPLPRTWAY